MKLKKMLGIRKKQKGNKIRHYFLGIHVWKIRYCATKIKIYFLGLKVLSIPREVITVIKKERFCDISKDLNLKALEIIAERQNYTYNPKE